MKTAFLFPGQGAQYPGMAKDLFEAFPEVKELFQLASDTTGIDTKHLLFEGTEEQLKETVNTQIAITLANLSSAAALKAKGIECEGCAGFSLGEYAALVHSGVIALDKIFPLVKARGEFMAKAAASLDRSSGDPGMAAVMGLSPEKVEEVLGSAGISDLYGANYNSPVQVVISGTASALQAAEAPFKAAGAKRIITLKVSGPFHSPLLKQASLDLAAYLETIPFSDPKIPLYSNVTGDLVKTGAQAKDLAAKQVIAPVRWTTEESQLLKAGYGRLIEVGPGKVLQGLWTAFDSTVPCVLAGKLDQIQEIV